MKRIVILAVLLATAFPAPGQIQAGPWVCDASENSLTIVWTSELPGMAYVELEDGTVRYEMFAGRRIFERLHQVTLNGLERGAVVRYRVCGQNVKDDSNPRYPMFDDGYASEWYAVRTLDEKAKSCRFSIFNDIHMNREDYASLAAQVDSAATDFIFLNGDIVSAGNYELDSLVSYGIEPLGSLTQGLPFFFARGNHEGRGNNPKLISEVFRGSENASFYYTFRQGPVAFIVLDAGETGKSRSILFSGGDVYEEYLNEQMAWASAAMREPWFRRAPLKVCLLHVPMIDHEDKNDYLLQRWLNDHFMSILNKGGINLMIGADLHEYMLCEPGTMNNRFPIVVNDDAHRMDVDYTRGGPVHIKSYGPDGKLEFQFNYSK